MRLIKANETFEDPLAMERHTNRGEIYEIDGLPVMYNVYQHLPFFSDSNFYCDGTQSDQCAESLATRDMPDSTSNPRSPYGVLQPYQGRPDRR